MTPLQRRRLLERLTKPELISLIVEGCPTCTTGPGRETVNMVCQTCGRDYAQGESSPVDDRGETRLRTGHGPLKP